MMIKDKMNWDFWNGKISKNIVLTFLLECEIFRQMTALVVPSEEEQCVWMAQFKCPQVQHAL